MGVFQRLRWGLAADVSDRKRHALHELPNIHCKKMASRLVDRLVGMLADMPADRQAERPAEQLDIRYIDFQELLGKRCTKSKSSVGCKIRRKNPVVVAVASGGTGKQATGRKTLAQCFATRKLVQVRKAVSTVRVNSRQCSCCLAVVAVVRIPLKNHHS